MTEWTYEDMPTSTPQWVRDEVKRLREQVQLLRSGAAYIHQCKQNDELREAVEVLGRECGDWRREFKRFVTSRQANPLFWDKESASVNANPTARAAVENKHE